MRLYDTAYWLENGATYHEKFQGGIQAVAQEVAIMDTLRTLQFDSVIEIGCGFGRVTRLLLCEYPGIRYLATDVSPDMLEQARLHCAPHDVRTRVFDLDDEPDLSQRSELVLAASVLMHREPAKVAGDVAKLVALSSKYVLSVDWHEPERTDEVEGCWQHDFSALFAPFGSVELQPRSPRQAIWLTTLEPLYATTQIGQNWEGKAS